MKQKHLQELLICIIKNISDLTGIEAFTNITGLLLTNNALTTINVSQNTALEYLWVKNNNLSSINISQNTALEYFSCEENQITALDLSANNLNSSFYLVLVTS